MFLKNFYKLLATTNSLLSKTPHRVPTAPLRLQVDQNFLTQKIVADLIIGGHKILLGCREALLEEALSEEALLGPRACFFKHIF